MAGGAPSELHIRAGPLTMLFEPAGTFLRRVCLGETEVLRGIYAAVRDPHWATIPGELDDFAYEVHEKSFLITFTSSHLAREIDFSWRGRIEGHADGRVTFDFEGRANRQLLANRIGFCILHPTACAGSEVQVEHPDGSVTSGRFPGRIEPHQPFFSIRALRHRPCPGVEATVRMTGDVFEMEDQRNWTDASFKTYCRPLSLPAPFGLHAGESLSQRVELTINGAQTSPRTQGPIAGANATAPNRAQRPGSARGSRAEVTVELNGTRQGTLPPIGLMHAPGMEVIGTRLELLRGLAPAHLRVSLRNDRTGRDLADAIWLAGELGCRLELEMYLPEGDEEEFLNGVQDELRSLRSASAVPAVGRQRTGNNREQAPLARCLLLREGSAPIDEEAIFLARRTLPSRTPIGAGTDAFFTNLNRNPPPVGAVDGVCYSLNPQVHAFDDRSLIETLAMQGLTVLNARSIAAGKEVWVGPVQLRSPHNPGVEASGPEVSGIPAHADPRQASLLGAGWTVGSVRYLGQGGAAAITYFGTVGWTGVLPPGQHEPVPDGFPEGSLAFPLYHVLADVTEFAQAEQLSLRTSDPLTVEALALAQGARRRLLLANVSKQAVVVRVAGAPGSWRMRRLGSGELAYATADPGGFRRSEPERLGQKGASLSLELAAHEVVTLDEGM